MLVAGFSSCNDFLDVEAPSKVTDDQVFSSTEEADRLLNSVYQATCSGNTYGNAYLTTFNFNSDVEWSTSKSEIQSDSHNEWKLFDGEADGSNVKSTWDAAYQTIERANNFVSAAEKSELYGNADLYQMIGEAKCIRAMNYLDLVILWGDVPFTFTRTYDQESLIMPMGQRDEILTALINDLKEIAPKMKSVKEITEGVERCSKEFAWALIARIALYRGGYSLRPNTSDANAVGTMQRADDYAEYYKIARTYADSVIQEGTHALTNDYMKVFNDECNYQVVNNDDVIFEIPFVLNVNGNIGYIQGPKADLSSAGDTDHPWGKASGSVGLNAFYRFTFDSQDVRRNVVGYWSYAYSGVAALQNSYTNYCLKWSKLWDKSHTQGNTSEGNTGINFPYMRYADVLLMFAEAENEINGPTERAKEALKAVRERAFRSASNKAEMVDAYVGALGTKDDFFKAIVDERAWEFGGENLRWKDLVRWNLYNQVLYKCFWKYYGMGCDRDDSYDVDGNFNTLPNDFFYRVRTRAEWNAQVAENPDKYNAANYPEVFNFANTDASLGVVEAYKTWDEDFSIDNLWDSWGLNSKKMPNEGGSEGWQRVYLFNWIDENTGIAKAECRCSIRGYIYINEAGTIMTTNIPEYSDEVNLSNLPPVRYILPIPRDVVSRSIGQYKNYYGY